MADYQPLIAKAIAGLDRNSADARRAIYDRARTALVTQLRGVLPPLSEADITRERFALEDAIRKVEAEAAANRPEPPRRPPPPASSPPPAPRMPQAPPRSGDGAAGAQEPNGRRLRDVIADAEGLGGATAQSARAARDTLAAANIGEPSSARLEPRFSGPPSGASLRRRPPQSEPPATEPPAGEAPPMLPPQERQWAPAAPPAAPPVARDENGDAYGRDYGRDGALAAPQDRDAPPPYQPYVHDDGYGALAEQADDPVVRMPRSLRRPIMFGMAGLAVLLIAVVGYWQSGAIAGLFKSLTTAARNTAVQQQQQQTSRDAPAPGRAKISDRVGGQSDVPASQQAGAMVAQQVVLYEQETSEPKGKSYVGTAVWRTEMQPPAPGQPAEAVIRADITIPERAMAVKWSLRRNTDKSLPASHTIEIMFVLPADFSHGAVNDIPGILMKQSEQARGVPLSGTRVKVTSSFFLIGLSAGEVDLSRNLPLLKERGWFDIPIAYTDNTRAILAVEKGIPGDRAFQDAFASWGQ